MELQDNVRGAEGLSIPILYDDNFLERQAETWKIEDSSIRRGFIRGCKNGVVRSVVNSDAKKVSNFTLELGFWHAMRLGHNNVVQKLVGRVSQDTVERFFREENFISGRVFRILLSHVGEDVKRERLLKACSLGEALLAQSIVVEGRVSPVLILEGIRKAIDLKNDMIVSLLFEQLSFEDQKVVLGYLLNKNRADLFFVLARNSKSEVCLRDIFLSECHKGRLDNVLVLIRGVNSDLSEEWFVCALKAGFSDVAAHLVESVLDGRSILNSIERASVQGESDELIVRLFFYLNNTKDRGVAFGILMITNRLRAITILSENLPQSEYNLVLTNGFFKLVLCGGDYLPQVNYWVDKVFFETLIGAFKRLCSVRARLEYFQLVLKELLADPVKIGFDTTRLDSVFQWRQYAINRGANIIKDTNKLRLLVHYVNDQFVLDRMFSYAHRERDVELFRSLIGCVSDRMYFRVKALLLDYKKIVDNGLSSDWPVRSLEGNEVNVAEVKLRFVDYSLERICQIMNENPRQAVEEG